MDRSPSPWLLTALLALAPWARPVFAEDMQNAFPIQSEHFSIATCGIGACDLDSDIATPELLQKVRQHIAAAKLVVQTSDEVYLWMRGLGFREPYLDRLEGRFSIGWHHGLRTFKCSSKEVIACIPTDGKTGKPMLYLVNAKNLDFDSSINDASLVLAHETSHIFTRSSKETLWLNEAYATALERAWAKKKSLPFGELDLNLDLPFNGASSLAGDKGYERSHYLYSLGKAANSPHGVAYLTGFQDHFRAGFARGMSHLYDGVPEGFSFPEYFPKYVAGFNSLDSAYYQEISDFKEPPFVHFRDRAQTYRFEERGEAKVLVFSAKPIHLSRVRVEAAAGVPEKSRLALATLRLEGSDPDLRLAFEDRLGPVHAYGVLGGAPGETRDFDGGLARVIYAPANLESPPDAERSFELTYSLAPLEPQIPTCVRRGTRIQVFGDGLGEVSPSNLTLLVNEREVEGYSVEAKDLGSLRLELKLEDPVRRDASSRGGGGAGGSDLWPAVVELGEVDVVREDCMIRMIGLGEDPSDSAAVVTYVPSRGFTVFSSRDEAGGAYLRRGAARIYAPEVGWMEAPPHVVEMMQGAMAGKMGGFPGLENGGGDLSFVEMPLMLTERLGLAAVRLLDQEGRLDVTFSTGPCVDGGRECARASYTGDAGAVSLEYDEADRLRRMVLRGRVVAEFEYGSFAVKIPPGW
ncbi:MAG: hypothetical protein AAF725_13545 [Acidobacteriota bacterium]